ncbi:MAG: hypothetical protein AB1758_24810 [Candidatus Eremiobacterota bacterium]
MSQRTSLVLDEESQQAARELARHFQISQSEAIRRALIAYRNQVRGVPPEVRSQRRRILEELFVLFEGQDPEAEVRRLKEEDEWA